MIWKKIIVAMLAVSVVFSGCARHGEIDTETPAPTERVTEAPQNETLEVREAKPYYSNIDDWYDSDGKIVMPITQNRELWLNSPGYLDRIKLCALPEELLKSVSTADLVVLMTQCPRNYYMNMYGDVEEGMKEVEAGFNGLRELLEREDCAEEVLKFYKNYQIPEKKSFREETASEAGLTEIEDIIKVEEFNKQLDDDAEVGYALNSYEWVLTRAPIVNKLSDEQLQEIVKVMQEKNAQLQKTEYADSIENYLLKAAGERMLPCLYRYGL